MDFKLRELDWSMQKIYETHFEELCKRREGMEVMVGFPCAVCVPEVGWRRGNVTALLGHQTCLVNLIDFQSLGVFHIKDIYPLTDEFKEFKLLLKCSLAGIKPTFGVWCEDACNL